MAARKREAQLGSSNVFADIGARDSEEMLVKAELSGRIVDIIRARGLTQTVAARTLDIDQPRVSALFHGKIRQFSVERLMRFLTALDRDVRIVVEKTPHRRRGRVVVEAA